MSSISYELASTLSKNKLEKVEEILTDSFVIRMKIELFIWKDVGYNEF